MNPQQVENRRQIASVLLVLAGALLVFAALGFIYEFFEVQINDALDNLPITSPSQEFSSVWDLVVSFAAFGFVILINFLLLPSIVTGPWTLTALAGLCLLAGGYIRLRIRRREASGA